MYRTVEVLVEGLSTRQLKVLMGYGIKIDSPDVYFVDVDYALYSRLKPLFDEWGCKQYVRASFSDKERKKAEYSILYNCTTGGMYPQPEGDPDLWTELVYDKTMLCMKCGCNKIQTGSFRLRKSRMSKSKLFTLNWVYDAFFVQRDFYHRIFEPLGIGYRHVRQLRGDEIVDSVVQLDIPIIDEYLNIEENNEDFELCPVCGTKKFSPEVSNFFPIHKHPLPHMYFSKEYFGYGGQAFRRLFVTKELREMLISEKMAKPAWFAPCKF